MARTASYACGLLTATALAAVPACAKVAEPDSIADMSLEQLSDVIVTSVSRQQERLSSTAAAIFIISASDIRRSGAQSLPEALQLAPNLQVARVDARNWAVTARGFNSAFANKLLVLIDGRSIYSPLFSGVFWDAQDVVMEDIERIEVISGPGATIWGANAVNGVINVITRASADTQGGQLSYAGASRDQNGAARYGGTLANGGSYRLYGKYQQLDDTVTASGANTRTGMHRSQAGFRADWALQEAALTLSGDGYQGQLGQAIALPVHISGANLQGRYTRKLGPEANLRLQLILDHTERNQPGQFAERLSTLDLDAQHDLRLSPRNVLTWGGGYRQSHDKVTSLQGSAFLPGDLHLSWANLFAQDEFAVTPDLKLTAGAKVEHNHYTGAEYLPSLRLAWTPDSSQLVWSSLARTVRAPSRFDRDLYSPGAPTVVVGGRHLYLVGGNTSFESEVARVVELGYRAQPAAALSYSATAYYSRYDKLRTLEPVTGPAATALYAFDNRAEGSSRGIELWGRWQATPAWRLNAGLVVQRVQQQLLPGSRDLTGALGLLPNDPSRHWLLRSSHDLTDNSTLDLALRYTSALPRPAVPAYYELDGQWMWQAQPNLELALIGRNLLHGSHLEYGGPPGRSVIERSVLLKLTLRF